MKKLFPILLLSICSLYGYGQGDYQGVKLDSVFYEVADSVWISKHQSDLVINTSLYMLIEGMPDKYPPTRPFSDLADSIPKKQVAKKIVAAFPGPGHNGYRTRIYYKGVQKTKGYKITVSPEMKHDSLMVAKYNYKLDSLKKWERRELFDIDKGRRITWTDSLNKYRNRFSEDLDIADKKGRASIKK